VRDLAVLFLHLLATVARLAGPGGARSVVAESVLVKHQLLILNRSVEGGRAEQGPRTGVMLTRDGPNVSYRQSSVAPWRCTVYVPAASFEIAASRSLEFKDYLSWSGRKVR
jgi:hypothetical protein